MTGRVIDLSRIDGTVDQVEVTGLPYPEFVALIDAHPSALDSHDRWNDATFYPALIRSCVTSSHVDDDLARSLLAEPDAGVLIMACLDECETQDLDPIRHRLATDGRLYVEVQACTSMGVPHSQFVTWPQGDRDLVVAFDLMKRDTCPGCGVPSHDMAGFTSPWQIRQRQCGRCLERAHVISSISKSGATAVDMESVHVDLIYSPDQPGDDDEDGD